MADFLNDMGMQINFIYVVHPHVNRLAKSTNKLILKGIKNKLDKAKGLWAEQLHKVLWS